jgi:hypothetical protein
LQLVNLKDFKAGVDKSKTDNIVLIAMSFILFQIGSKLIFFFKEIPF